MEIIKLIMSAIGLSESQAKGGAGLLLKLAQSQLDSGGFDKIKNLIPDIGDIISSAPSDEDGIAGALGSITSALGVEDSKLAGFATLAAGFSKLDMNTEQVGGLTQTLLSFLEEKGGNEVKNLVEGLWK